ncbi:TetR family transcriptional regulator [Nocardia sp. NPDC051570]|uniref:TetR family transcriptional regulator n=1 Tax=Nocardia sp. NPDC051570 TaxID=3364324 RepID=UPI0037A5ED7F
MAESAGVREQAKTRMRRQLVEAALQLFEERGFDEVTVQEIADLAGVTRRTFNRYFPSKAAVVFANDDELIAQLLVALDRRPASESVLAATRAAGRELLLGDSEVTLRAHQVDSMRRVRRLLTSHPGLRQAHFTGVTGRVQALTQRYAERSGLPVSDLRPQVAASAYFGGLGIGIDHWIARGDHEVTALFEIVDSIITGLQTGIDLPAAPVAAAN